MCASCAESESQSIASSSAPTLHPEVPAGCCRVLMHGHLPLSTMTVECAHTHLQELKQQGSGRAHRIVADSQTSLLHKHLAAAEPLHGRHV